MPEQKWLDSEKDFVFLVDSNTLEIKKIGRAAENVYGECVGKFVYDLMPFLCSQKTCPEISETLKSTSIFSCKDNQDGKLWIFHWAKNLDETTCVLRTVITDGLNNQDKYRELFEKSSDAILILNKEKIFDNNPRAQEIFAYSHDEILKINPFNFKDGLFELTSEELYIHKFNKAQEGESQKIEITCCRKDGSTFYAEVSMSSFYIDGQNLVQQIIRDVSDRVLFEQAIKESEERFRLLSKVAIESVAFVKNDVIIDCNEQLAAMLIDGRRHQLIGKNITDFIKVNEYERIKDILEIETYNKSEIRSLNKSGELLILETSSSYINYRGEDVIVMLCYDITSRKRAEQALEQSSERFKNLVENSPNAVFILTDGKVKYTNQSGVGLLGLKEEDELYDKNFADFFVGKTRKIIQGDFERIRQGKDVDYREIQILDDQENLIDIGIKTTLTVYDRKPSIQVTVNNLSTRMLLLQEQVRAQLAEEINEILKKEIEEHKKTQKKLQETKNFTRNIIESSIDMIIAVDEDYRITEFNTAAQKQFIYDPKAVLNKKVDMLFSSKKEFKAVNNALIKYGSFSGEIGNKTSVGNEFTSLLSASLIKTPEGKVIGSMGVLRDITELKEAERGLIESEERYRDIFENASDFILSVDDKGHFIYFNKSFKETLGYTEFEIAKLSLFDVVDEGCLRNKKSLFNSLVSKELGLIFTSKNGERIITEGESSIRYKNEKRHSLRVILRDVTKSKKHEQEILEQKAKLESIFNSTENMMIWTMDRNFSVTSCNKNFIEVSESLFGAKVDVGTNYMNLLEQHVFENLYQGQLIYFEKAFLGNPTRFELPMSAKKGGPMWLQVFLNPIYVDGQMNEISCLSYDITDRIQINRRIRDSLKEKEVLLQEVHHRVKNNLQVISSILNLQSSYVDDEKTLEILRESQDRIKTMSFIHESLYQNTDISQIDFPEYLDSLARSLISSYSMTSSRVKLEVYFDEVCLSLNQAIPCGLIVNELITNAMKYAFVDLKHPTLKLAVRKKEKEISLLVQDNGVGLPENFKYEDSDSLGIQLVYTLVEQLDGTIHVNSDEGTAFLITFEKL